MSSSLFSSLTLRSVTFRNRIVISPMCQYSAVDGEATDWHFVHLGRFAMGGAGAVFIEVTGISPEGRITPGCTGLWAERHVAPFKRITDFLKAHDTIPGIQLGHAGRKASRPRPWQTIKELPADGPDAAWQTVGPSPVAYEGWPAPLALDEAGLERIRSDWRSALGYARAAGFEVVELHAAHGYLLDQFLSPHANRRTDRYGGDRAGRMRFPLEIARLARECWPQDRPVFVRVSAVDWTDNGWSLDDTVVFARELKALGVDLVDCSSGGNVPVPPRRFEAGYQVPFAERVRREAGIATMAVGLVTEAAQADAIIAGGRADLVAIAREALADPQWPLNAARALGDDPDFHLWPVQVGDRLAARERMRRT